ncbi:MAG: 30S ribosomal protein S21 [Chloroflexi bacterium]|nr:30S ribosomal protein S21 [Chloroflexota bacterium]|tara:strand:+ start:475 stop:720 length:246 start_codon:yes stop_codon:yes gene_type:complete
MSKSVVRISVKNKNNNNFRTLQIFKNKVNDEGIIQDLKKKEYYVKPSMRKRLKKENAEKQRTKDLNKDIKNALKSQNDLFS